MEEGDHASLCCEKQLLRNLAYGAMALCLLACNAANAHAPSRDRVAIVGSSTVYPFATVVAERFGRSTVFKAPKVESTGSGGGLKLFCKGISAATPDIANVSRRIKKSEYDRCQANGVTDIVEVLMGYDGIVIANAKSAPVMSLTLKDIYLALAKDVPGSGGTLIPNPNKTWRDVNEALPDVDIEVLGPPPTSGTRDAFAELAMGGGAMSFPALAQLRRIPAADEQALRVAIHQLGMPGTLYDALKAAGGRAPDGTTVFEAIAYAVREDGTYIEAGESDNLIVQKLEANPSALGIFGFSFLDENSDKVHGSTIDGIAPSFETIAGRRYPVSRPLYFYIKGAHVGKIPGIREYAMEFTSKRALGEEGYLADRGLIPLAPAQLKQVQMSVKFLRRLEL